METEREAQGEQSMGREGKPMDSLIASAVFAGGTRATRSIDLVEPWTL